MAEITTVCIGIQARSNSTRLPDKVNKLIHEKTVLNHVIDACKKSMLYINKYTSSTHILVNLAMLVPHNDPIALDYKKKIRIFQGPEDDVLKRYATMGDRMNADYVVRITGDCPLIPPALITKHINTAIMNKYDYLTNTHLDTRTAPDGHDCEIISKAALTWLSQNASTDSEREHVTLLLKEKTPPDWMSIGTIIHSLDLSGFKISVDTEEDLEKAVKMYHSIYNKAERARKKYGDRSVHRF